MLSLMPREGGGARDPGDLAAQSYADGRTHEQASNNSWTCQQECTPVHRPIATLWTETPSLSGRSAGKAAGTRFICRRLYRRAVESDGNVRFVRNLTGNPRLPRGEARPITLKEGRLNSGR